MVQEAAHPDANIIFGANIDDSLGDQVWVTVIATRFDGRARAPRPRRRPDDRHPRPTAPAPDRARDGEELGAPARPRARRPRVRPAG